MSKGKELLKNLKFYDSYSKYREDLGRKETWEESVDDVMSMHYNKFKDISELLPYLDKATKMYKEGKVLASQRNLQYRESQILKSNTRLFNCASTYIDRPEVFKQILFVLLNGCGMGYSVEQRFIDKLPTIQTRKEQTVTHLVEDSIEGWANALDKLMMSFFDGTEQIRFDGSLIREEGSHISGGFQAPGYAPLKKSLEIIEKLLQDKVNKKDFKITTLDAHEIICISADSVLSAGVRRSALICLFDKEDNLMLNCKTGDWFYKKAHLARSNNTIKLVLGEFTKKEFDNLKESIKEFGEPGVAIVKDKAFTTNPCQPKWATVLTPNGISTMGAINEGDMIWSSEGWTKVIKKWSTGEKDVYSYRTTSGEFVGTENHKLISNGIKIEAKDCENIDSLTGNVESVLHNPQTVMDGLVLGDGGIHKASGDLKLLYIGEDDSDYLDSEIAPFILKERMGISPYAWEIQTTILAPELIAMHERSVPKRYKEGTHSEVASFLRGLYSVNGSVVSNRITYKTASAKLRDDIQIMLSSLGIRSYFTTNKSKEVEFANGLYTCKQSYDINISTDRAKFVNLIGFLQEYKNEKINSTVSDKAKTNFPIQSVEYVSTEEVFDITVDNDSHTYWTGGVNVSNCFEIGFIPVNPKTGNSCISFCNLNEINGGLCTTKERFFEACEAAAIIGTLQASYTTMPFLGSDTEELIREEALIGISITGIMDNPKILLDAETLRKGAEIVNRTNEIVASIIKINPAARTTCVKPSGNASVLLKTSSGIHPAHSSKYFRIMQMNKGTEMAKSLKAHNPILLEDSVWSASGNDYAVYIPIDEKEGIITKEQLNDIEFTEHVKTVYQNWVLPGNHTDRGYSSRVTHNVSNTITVNDWDKVFDYIFDNQAYFCGLSFIPSTGDKIYKQAPFTKVFSFEELIKEYGDGSIFASGLIIDALHAFGGDLWDACEASKNKEFSLSGDRVTALVKKDIISRIKKFSKNYYKNDIEKTISCLKDVYLFHKWKTINRDFKTIDFTTLDMKPSYKNVNELGGVACSGPDGCEITFM